MDYPTRAITVTSSTMFKSEEFAKQIHYLYHTEMDRAMAKVRKSGREFTEQRDVPHPMYCSQWLLGVVSNRSTVVDDGCRVISKKMRDEIIMGAGSLPFRRSGFYTAAKVFLQLGLTIALCDERGKFLYKLIMLKFMCRSYNDKTIDDDIAVQIISKIARRMDKIEHYSKSFDELGSELVELKNAVISSARKLVKDVRTKMDRHLCSILANECRKGYLEAMPRLPFERDKIHQIPNILQYIDFRNKKMDAKSVQKPSKPRQIIRQPRMPLIYMFSSERYSPFIENRESIDGPPFNSMYANIKAEYDDFRSQGFVSESVNESPQPRQITRHPWQNVNRPEVQKIQNIHGEVDTLQLLADVENWILATLDKNYPNLCADYLGELSTAYLSKAQEFYRDDCFGYSKMVLSMLKIIQVYIYGFWNASFYSL